MKQRYPKHAKRDTDKFQFERNSGKVISTENGSRLQTWPLGAGIICGIVLFAAMTFQQYGISVYPQGVAASGRSGFITATYVVMVSVVSVFMGKKMHWITGVSVAGFYL